MASVRMSETISMVASAADGIDASAIAIDVVAADSPRTMGSNTSSSIHSIRVSISNISSISTASSSNSASAADGADDAIVVAAVADSRRTTWRAGRSVP